MKTRRPDSNWTWPKSCIRWIQDDRVHVSVPFTWLLPRLRDELSTGLLGEDTPVVGGPAVRLMPEYLAGLGEIGDDSPGVLQRVNPRATRTTVGCPNACGFCAVPKIEGGFRELADWPNLPIVCDSNLLAASRAHFDRVIDGLKPFAGVDFNQGLDARLMTRHHAQRLAELDCRVRLSWDTRVQEPHVLRAVSLLRQAGIPRDRINCYVLIGWQDTPEDALDRLQCVRWGLGIWPDVQRYVSLDSLTGRYVGPGWTEAELVRFCRYWNNLRHVSGVPFEEFGYGEPDTQPAFAGI